MNKFSITLFKKRKFRITGEEFELDAATPLDGPINLGIDIKRIEARRDIHKRCDEIVNKAAKLKASSPESTFAAVIYYPFVEEHANVASRLKSENIDAVIFAGNSDASIENAVRMLLSQLHMAKDILPPPAVPFNPTES